MDRRERLHDEKEELLRLAFRAMQSRMWTALPGVVVAYPSASGLGPMIADIQPTINGSYRDTDGSERDIQMPVLLDCPVLWQGGGGVTSVFPIAPKDECLVIFASRCIDSWWKQGWLAGSPSAPNPAMRPPEFRMHTLSDGFALVGVRSLPRAYAPPPGVAAIMRDDGSTYWQLNPTAKTLKLTAHFFFNIKCFEIYTNANITTAATVTAATDVVGGGHSLKGHVHPDPQGGNVGTPIG